MDCTCKPRLSLLLALAAPLACAQPYTTTSETDATDTDASTGEETTETTAGPTSDSETSDTDTDTDTTGGLLPPADIPEGCNPVAYQIDCMLPYPSDVFLVPDGTSPSGMRVELTEIAEPTTEDGDSINPMVHHPADGFPGHMPILALLPMGVDKDDLLFHTDNPELSLGPDNTTTLLDAETGEPVPHWAELDAMTSDPSRQVLLVRSYVPLEPERRYIVALHGLHDASGGLIEPPLGFAHVALGEVEDHPVLAPLAARYEDEVFPPLESFGLARDELQLAWDFTVSSEQRNMQDMLSIRDHVLAAIDQVPPAVTIDKVIYDHNDHIAMRVEGKIEVPLYLEEDKPMARLWRNGSGKVVANGTHKVEFTLQVPYSAFPDAPGFTPARLLQYGHGFFGSREEINYGSFMRGFSDEQRYITAAVDWVGMAEEDQIEVVKTINTDPSAMFTFTDRLHQSFANQLALTVALKTTMAKVPELTMFGQLLYDVDQVYWYGISQGSIFGVTLMSLSPEFERGVLGVGGAPYSLMMTRSATFSDLFEIAKAAIGDDPIAIQKFIALSQHTLDFVDPITYARHLIREPLPMSPDRKVLFQFGIGDHSVNNLASDVLARAAGTPVLQPSPWEIYGTEKVNAPVDDTAVTVIDFMLDFIPGIDAKLPTEDEKNDVHESVRHNPGAKMQIDAFLRPGGVIEHFCDGPCDPD
ncbi:MAG: hypothetical protein R3A51_13480 [Nannocystaceae bacterium]